jgi:hypothetical protein
MDTTTRKELWLHSLKSNLSPPVLPLHFPSKTHGSPVPPRRSHPTSPRSRHPQTKFLKEAAMPRCDGQRYSVSQWCSRGNLLLSHAFSGTQASQSDPHPQRSQTQEDHPRAHSPYRSARSSLPPLPNPW